MSRAARWGLLPGSPECVGALKMPALSAGSDDGLPPGLSGELSVQFPPPIPQLCSFTHTHTHTHTELWLGQQAKLSSFIAEEQSGVENPIWLDYIDLQCFDTESHATQTSGTESYISSE